MVKEGTILRAGEAFGDFTIERFLSDDLRTETYLAVRGGEEVAIKCMAMDRVEAPPSPEAFAAGVRRLQTLCDEGIPTIYGGGILDGVAWLAGRHIEGGSLHDLAVGLEAYMYTFVLAQTLEWAVTIRAAHSAGFLHGDLNPGNILFESKSDEPGVRIIGFGCTELFGTTAAIMLETPLYRAPEQILGGEISVRTDIYAFGMSLYETLARRQPYASPRGALPNLLKLRTLALQEEPTPLTKIYRTFPKFVATLIEKMIAKDPRNRFETMAEVIEALEDAVGRLAVWSMTYEAGGKVKATVRESIKRTLDSEPALETKSGHRLSRTVQFGLHGYEAPPLDSDADADTDPGGPPAALLRPAEKPAEPRADAQEAGQANGQAALEVKPAPVARGSSDPAAPVARGSSDPAAPVARGSSDPAAPVARGSSDPAAPAPPCDEVEPAPETLRTTSLKPSAQPEASPPPVRLRSKRAMRDQPAVALLMLALSCGALSLALDGRRSSDRLNAHSTGLRVGSFPGLAKPQDEEASPQRSSTPPSSVEIDTPGPAERGATSPTAPRRSPPPDVAPAAADAVVPAADSPAASPAPTEGWIPPLEPVALTASAEEKPKTWQRTPRNWKNW